MKHEREPEQKPDYVPLQWVQVSGFDSEVDARHVASLSTQARRRHEIWRLKHFHGGAYASQVEQRAREIFAANRQK